MSTVLRLAGEGMNYCSEERLVLLLYKSVAFDLRWSFHTCKLSFDIEKQKKAVSKFVLIYISHCISANVKCVFRTQHEKYLCAFFGCYI